MKYIDEYRNPSVLKKLTREIEKTAEKIQDEVHLMEVCGTHTMAIGRYGIRKLLPKNIKLISGPGCPVCVTPNSYIDRVVLLSQRKDIIITTFGDMVKVPGTFSSLEKKKAEGRDIRIVYSPLEALEIAKQSPSKNVVFLGVGFETTAPLVALVINKAYEEKIKNFSVFSGHKLIPPALEALMEDKETKIDGFICPGHVSTIIGSNPYVSISKRYKVPCVIAGFEPVDILAGIILLIRQLVENRNDVEIEYKRVVQKNGNIEAQKIMEEVFDVVDSEWRGLGVIKKSGLKIKEKYKEMDAEYLFPVQIQKSERKCGCICGEILKGRKIPTECPLFGKRCTPENPFGPCMVSSEGTCAAYYKYER